MERSGSCLVALCILALVTGKNIILRMLQTKFMTLALQCYQARLSGKALTLFVCLLIGNRFCRCMLIGELSSIAVFLQLLEKHHQTKNASFGL